MDWLPRAVPEKQYWPFIITLAYANVLMIWPLCTNGAHFAVLLIAILIPWVAIGAVLEWEEQTRKKGR